MPPEALNRGKSIGAASAGKGQWAQRGWQLPTVKAGTGFPRPGSQSGADSLSLPTHLRQTVRLGHSLLSSQVLLSLLQRLAELCGQGWT